MEQIGLVRESGGADSLAFAARARVRLCDFSTIACITHIALLFTSRRLATRPFDERPAHHLH